MHESKLNIKHLEPKPLHQALKCLQRKITEVFMIDLVKPALADEIAHPVHFADKYSLIPDKMPDAPHDIIKIVNMGEYVAGNHESNRTINGPRQLFRKKLADGWYSLCSRQLCYVVRGFNIEYSSIHMFQQYAVISAD